MGIYDGHGNVSLIRLPARSVALRCVVLVEKWVVEIEGSDGPRQIPSDPDQSANGYDELVIWYSHDIMYG